MEREVHHESKNNSCYKKKSWLADKLQKHSCTHKISNCLIRLQQNLNKILIYAYYANYDGSAFGLATCLSHLPKAWPKASLYFLQNTSIIELSLWPWYIFHPGAWSASSLKTHSSCTSPKLYTVYYFFLIYRVFWECNVL